MDDLNIHDFTLKGLSFRGTEPLEIIFMVNALRDRLNIYDVDALDGKTETEAELETMGAAGPANRKEAPCNNDG